MIVRRVQLRNPFLQRNGKIYYCNTMCYGSCIDPWDSFQITLSKYPTFCHIRISILLILFQRTHSGSNACVLESNVSLAGPRFVILITPNITVDAANFLYYNIVCHFSLPRSIQSNNGPHFVNDYRASHSNPEILHKVSTPYYPQSNGPAERLIETLKFMMTKAVEYTDRDETNGNVNWQPAVYTVLYVY